MEDAIEFVLCQIKLCGESISKRTLPRATATDDPDTIHIGNVSVEYQRIAHESCCSAVRSLSSSHVVCSADNVTLGWKSKRFWPVTPKQVSAAGSKRAVWSEDRRFLSLRSFGVLFRWVGRFAAAIAGVVRTEPLQLKTNRFVILSSYAATRKPSNDFVLQTKVTSCPSLPISKSNKSATKRKKFATERR